MEIPSWVAFAMHQCIRKACVAQSTALHYIPGESKAKMQGDIELTRLRLWGDVLGSALNPQASENELVSVNLAPILKDIQDREDAIAISLETEFPGILREFDDSELQ